ncbi:ankyrin repeat domain-containing protein 60 isoform X3 [Gallus gallus]|uniref:ankyrin repeat domain-containing protein 60 isoform X3 n=1 Tax=Gallus gallus TaxID=9031 RepID=UPI001AE1D1E3|nr:ankyrin repeat domain-containing protein 60 isoform X3 [Gallus gallus]XP_040506975.1 ankyrin repeat domain-containing protein 60 isoform X3 [Gallus gallus]
MPRSTLPLQTLKIQLRLAETNEIFSLPQCQNDLTLKQLKSDLELLTGIPFHFQRLHYLDEIDLPDDSTFMDNDIVPGGTITMRIWKQDGWGHLVAAAVKGDTLKLVQLGVTEEYAGTSPYAKILGPEQKKEWVAHRAFVALFVASHRGHVNTVKFLLSHGADVRSKTPLGRTALHVAAVMGRCECIELLFKIATYREEKLFLPVDVEVGRWQWGRQGVSQHHNQLRVAALHPPPTVVLHLSPV